MSPAASAHEMSPWTAREMSLYASSAPSATSLYRDAAMPPLTSTQPFHSPLATGPLGLLDQELALHSMAVCWAARSPACAAAAMTASPKRTAVKIVGWA